MKTHFRNKFLAGTFAAIPIAVTAFVLWYVETETRRLTHTRIPFLGVLIAIAAIYVLGVVVTSLAGKYLLTLVDRLLSRVPLLRELYIAWKQITLTSDGSQGVFTRVVLLPTDGGQSWTLGFSSGQGIPGDPQTTCVFVPAAPNPTSGRMLLVPLSRCRMVDVSVEEAFKMILSGGNYVPGGLAVTNEAPVAAPAAP